MDNQFDIFSDEGFVVEDIPTEDDRPFGHIEFCQAQCEFYKNCKSNNENCIMRRFDDILCTLTPREARIIKMHYGLESQKCTSIEEIAISFAISEERIEQILNKALRKLRHPSRRKKMIQISDCIFAIDETNISKFICTLFDYKGSNAEILAEILAEKQNIEKIHSSSGDAIVLSPNTTIEECDFSVRSFNCLKRAGVNTVQDIIELDALKLLSIRNLGRKSIEEILQKLDNSGLRVSDCRQEDYPELELYLSQIVQIGELEKLSNLSIRDLNLNKRIANSLTKIGINSISDLLKKTRAELLSTKIFGGKGIDAITDALMVYDLHLSHDEIYECNKCGKNFVSECCFDVKHYCRICSSKLDRISEISRFTISLTGPEYSSYTRTGDGFVLYANVTNTTEELVKVKLLEFYVVSGDRQRAPDSYLTGYVFDEETIMPMTSKCCAKIWPLSVMNGHRLEKNDYALITLSSNKTTYMFKFIFDGSYWIIDDYFEE